MEMQIKIQAIRMTDKIHRNSNITRTIGYIKGKVMYTIEHLLVHKNYNLN